MTLISFCNALLESETDETFFNTAAGLGCFLTAFTTFFLLVLETIYDELRN